MMLIDPILHRGGALKNRLAPQAELLPVFRPRPPKRSGNFPKPVELVKIFAAIRSALGAHWGTRGNVPAVTAYSRTNRGHRSPHVTIRFAIYTFVGQIETSRTPSISTYSTGDTGDPGDIVYESVVRRVTSTQFKVVTEW